MGKRRFVSPDDENDLEENLKRSKNPLEMRNGILERSEHLRQIFQGTILFFFKYVETSAILYTLGFTIIYT